VVGELDAQFCPHCGDPLPRVARRAEPGDVIDLGWGKAVLGDALGEGGMGIVHRAWLYYNPLGPRAGTPAHAAAVKLLNPLLHGSARARRLFIGEADALARLCHPNIVRFHGFTEDRRRLALIMEMVEGQALDQIIGDAMRHARPGGIPALPMVQAWHYFSQLLGALAATHELCIVHRDVKPSNVLVRFDGIVKLTDYGIARVPAEEVRKTGGIAPGTGAYMAPEQVQGSELDARTDLYSAAIVLYEMLSGVTPFDTPSRNEIMVRAAQIEETPPPLSVHVPQAPKVLDLLFARALAKDPLHRFPSAVDLGEALRVALGLPDTAGWKAQRDLAQRARSVSRIGLDEASQPTDVTADQADQLRTNVMTAYRG
jgi:serine/threonine-protein kinase